MFAEVSKPNLKAASAASKIGSNSALSWSALKTDSVSSIRAPSVFSRKSMTRDHTVPDIFVATELRSIHFETALANSVSSIFDADLMSALNFVASFKDRLLGHESGGHTPRCARNSVWRSFLERGTKLTNESGTACKTASAMS